MARLALVTLVQAAFWGGGVFDRAGVGPSPVDAAGKRAGDLAPDVRARSEAAADLPPWDGTPDREQPDTSPIDSGQHEAGADPPDCASHAAEDGDTAHGGSGGSGDGGDGGWRDVPDGENGYNSDDGGGGGGVGFVLAASPGLDNQGATTSPNITTAP